MPGGHGFSAAGEVERDMARVALNLIDHQRLVRRRSVDGPDAFFLPFGDARVAEGPF
jgi:hypothetical protein